MAESERSKVSLRSASEKRSRGSPTGCTPLQKGKRSTTELKEVGESQQTGSHHCQPRRRRLAFAKTDAWSDSELVEFILLHKPGRRWPAEQDPRFWDSAAKYIYICSHALEEAVQHIYMYIHVILMPRMQFYHVTSLTRPASSDVMCHVWSTSRVPSRVTSESRSQTLTCALGRTSVAVQ